MSFSLKPLLSFSRPSYTTNDSWQLFVLTLYVSFPPTFYTVSEPCTPILNHVKLIILSFRPSSPPSLTGRPVAAVDEPLWGVAAVVCVCVCLWQPYRLLLSGTSAGWGPCEDKALTLNTSPSVSWGLAAGLCGALPPHPSEWWWGGGARPSCRVKWGERICSGFCSFVGSRGSVSGGMQSRQPAALVVTWPSVLHQVSVQSQTQTKLACFQNSLSKPMS